MDTSQKVKLGRKILTAGILQIHINIILILLLINLALLLVWLTINYISYQATLEYHKNFTLTLLKHYKDIYLTKNRHARYWRYCLSDKVYYSCTLYEKDTYIDPKYIYFLEFKENYPEGKPYFETNDQVYHHFCHINAE